MSGRPPNQERIIKIQEILLRRNDQIEPFQGLASITDHQMEILRGVVIEGLTPGKIAEKLGVTRQAIQAQYQEAAKRVLETDATLNSLL